MSAQANPQGVPTELLEKKKEELRLQKVRGLFSRNKLGFHTDLRSWKPRKPPSNSVSVAKRKTAKVEKSTLSASANAKNAVVVVVVGVITDFRHPVGALKLHLPPPGAPGHPVAMIIHLRPGEVAVAEEEIDTARVGDVEKQTRTFRHHAGKLIAVILTTVKAGVTDLMDITTHARHRGVAEGILIRGTIVVRGILGHRGNGDAIVGGRQRGLELDLALAGAARGIGEAVQGAGLILPLHTPNQAPQLLDPCREALMSLRGHARGRR